jgi:hypothetical protein
LSIRSGKRTLNFDGPTHNIKLANVRCRTTSPTPLMRVSLDSVARVSCVEWSGPCGCEKVVQLGLTGDITEDSARSPSVMGGSTHSVRPLPPGWDTGMKTGKTDSFFSNPVSLSVACSNLVDPASRPRLRVANSPWPWRGYKKDPRRVGVKRIASGKFSSRRKLCGPVTALIAISYHISKGWPWADATGVWTDWSIIEHANG